MRIGRDQFRPVSLCCRKDDRVGHRQLMTDTQLRSSKRNLAVKIGNFPAQGFSDKFICNRLASPEKKNLSNFENDDGGNNYAPLGFKVGRKYRCLFI